MLAPDSPTSLKPWRDWITSAAEPTYLRTHVTGQVKEGSEIKLVRPSGGRGMAFSSVVHRLIEVMGQGKTIVPDAGLVPIPRLEVSCPPNHFAHTNPKKAAYRLLFLFI